MSYLIATTNIYICEWEAIAVSQIVLTHGGLTRYLCHRENALTWDLRRYVHDKLAQDISEIYSGIPNARVVEGDYLFPNLPRSLERHTQYLVGRFYFGLGATEAHLQLRSHRLQRSQCVTQNLRGFLRSGDRIGTLELRRTIECLFAEMISWHQREANLAPDVRATPVSNVNYQPAPIGFHS